MLFLPPRSSFSRVLSFPSTLASSVAPSSPNTFLLRSKHFKEDSVASIFLTVLKVFKPHMVISLIPPFLSGARPDTSVALSWSDSFPSALRSRDSRPPPICPTALTTTCNRWSGRSGQSRSRWKSNLRSSLRQSIAFLRSAVHTSETRTSSPYCTSPVSHQWLQHTSAATMNHGVPASSPVLLLASPFFFLLGVDFAARRRSAIVLSLAATDACSSVTCNCSRLMVSCGFSAGIFGMFSSLCSAHRLTC
mmetsp:Transcript_13947/g.20302  ORF Transcript_13947/g.20302 Transcript_13947/m.20302 type:complete len:249 (-) Transcript_13947:5-751(-)